VFLGEANEDKIESQGSFPRFCGLFFLTFAFFSQTPGEIHITLVGDKGSSKTTILKSFAQDATKDLSGVFEAVSYPITITGVKDKYILRLFDTDPDELFSRIRAITYKTTDIFVICFDLMNEDTFKNCRSWYAEVNQLSPKSPVLLVGTKVDQKLPRIDRKVPESLLQDLLMLYNYIEVDATDAHNVKKLIELAVSHLSL
jgi:small GTP-binding protein